MTQLRYPNRSDSVKNNNLPKITFSTRNLNVTAENVEESVGTDSVTLPLPKGYTISDSFIYEEFSFNLFQSVIEKGSTFDFTDVDALKEISKDLGARLGTTMGGNIFGDTIRGITDRKRGQVFNPRQFTLFKSPGLRTFSFTFEFLPVNSEEVSVIPKIIKFFRKNSYPATNTIDFIIPSYFSIGITNASSIIKLPVCNCTAISTNYNSEHLAYFKDPSAANEAFPGQIELGLTFQEIEITTQENIEDGI